jgi:hypothetical protein
MTTVRDKLKNWLKNRDSCNTESLDCLFLCTKCCKNLWIVCSCVPGVTRISGLSVLVYQVLQESLDCLFLCTRCYKNLWRQSRDYCNTWYTRTDNPEIIVTPGTQEQTMSVLVYQVLHESLNCLFLRTRCYKNLWIVCSCVTRTDNPEIIVTPATQEQIIQRLL